MSKYSKHLGKGQPVIIDGEEFILKPLGTEELPMFFKVMKAFSGAQLGATNEELLKNIDDEGLNAVKDMINITLKKSYPEEDEEEQKQFGLKYMMQLMGPIFELNSSVSKDVKRDVTVKKVQEKINANTSTT